MAIFHRFAPSRGALAASLLIACGAPNPAADAPERPPEARPTAAEAPESAPRQSAPELRPASDGPVAPLVAAAQAEAAAEGRPLVVYVGASWCEPCVAFHDALAAGELDAQLPPARFLEFDLDRDQQRLTEAGYTSRLIPLFVVPEADGRAGSRRVEGGVKGPRAVANLVGRLQPLLIDG
ncbi:MAG: thioredoxin family protein [Nannocystaceae bacterium]